MRSDVSSRSVRELGAVVEANGNKNLFDRSSRTKDKGSDGGVSISWDTDCRSYAGEKEWLHW
jgi:hypothetical protein